MKTLLVLTLVLAAVSARPQFGAITKFLTEAGQAGFKYWIESDDKQLRQEVAEIKNQGTDDEALSVQGFYSYVGDDGHLYEVGYTADENGFRPSGEHLPAAADVKRGPPVGIPPAALASLAGK